MQRPMSQGLPLVRAWTADTGTLLYHADQLSREPDMYRVVYIIKDAFTSEASAVRVRAIEELDMWDELVNVHMNVHQAHLILLRVVPFANPHWLEAFASQHWKCKKETLPAVQQSHLDMRVCGLTVGKHSSDVVHR